jgi:hypothetical protein
VFGPHLAVLIVFGPHLAVLIVFGPHLAVLIVFGPHLAVLIVFGPHLAVAIVFGPHLAVLIVFGPHLAVLMLAQASCALTAHRLHANDILLPSASPVNPPQAPLWQSQTGFKNAGIRVRALPLMTDRGLWFNQ